MDLFLFRTIMLRILQLTWSFTMLSGELEYSKNCSLPFVSIAQVISASDTQVISLLKVIFADKGAVQDANLSGKLLLPADPRKVT